MYKKFLFLTSFVLVLSLAYISYAADARMIKLDLNNTANNDDANTHTGFTKFAIPNSGSEVNSVVIDLGGNIDSRLRIDPNGRSYDDIYRDFIFGISPSGVTITLWGLGVNRECDITMWAYDNQSVPTRLADWTATWGDACDVNYIFTTDFNGGAENWPAGDGSTNYVATAKTDYLGRIMLTSTRGTGSPEGQPFSFVNALMVGPKGTFVETNYAHRPQPVDGAEAVPVDTVLKWRKGGLSEKRDVYLGTNFDDVNTADRSNPKGVLASQNQDANTYDPSGSYELEVGKTYYWRVDEVNTTPAPNSYWKGKVWSFNTFTIGQPIAWWKLDDGSGSIAYDSSGNNYHATIYGNPVWKTGSPHGGSGYLDFDGDGDYTDANYISGGDIQLPDLYTVTLWFKSEGGTSNRDMFSAIGINEGHGILLELRGDDVPAGRIRYIHRSPVSGTGGPSNESIYTPAGYNDNQWHHIAVQRASGGRYVYIDGGQVAQDTDTRPGLDLPLRIMFGVLRPGLLQRFWNGGIDDVRIYDRALSPTEIREVMRSKIASGPNPSNDATDVNFTLTLSWMPGLYAAGVNGHKVYLDPDKQNVTMRGGCQINGAITNDPCYGPIGPLSVGTTYYWAVDEYNDVCDTSPWQLPVPWHFKTVSYFVVENFDSYADNAALKAVWRDYWDNGSCAEVFTNQTTVRSGQSMEYRYKNYTYEPYYSEANATVASLGVDPNWLKMGAKAISLWFYGNLGNPIGEHDEMYFKLVDSDTPVHTATVFYSNYGDMTDLTEVSWHEWFIPLVDFSGVNLGKVSKIIIGFGDGTQAASDGVMYFEDIRLYASKCVLSERDIDFALVDFAPIGYSASGDCKVDNQELTIMVDDWLAEDDVVATQNPGEANLVAYYPLDEGSGTNAEDVVADHNGILAGDVSWITPGLIGSSAIHVPFTEGSRIDINTWNPVGNWDPDTNTGSLTLAVWARWAGTTGLPQGLICKRDLAWDVNGLMFGFEITAWPAYTTSMLALRGNTDVTSGNVTMDNYLGRWTHFAVTFPHPSGDPCDVNDFARLYINGREVASGAFTFGPNTVASMAIGNTTGVNGDAQNQTFNGDLDEVRIYNRALEPNEIAYLADTTPGDSELHIPVPSAAEVYNKEPVGQQLVNYKDFALVAERWLEEDLYP
jgi:hypothetical protein